MCDKGRVGFTAQLEGVKLKTESALRGKYVSARTLTLCSAVSLRQTFTHFVVHIIANLTKLLFAFTSCIGDLEKVAIYVTMSTKR